MNCKKNINSNVKLIQIHKLDSILKELVAIYPDHSRSELNILLENVRKSMGETFWQTSSAQIISNVTDYIFPETSQDQPAEAIPSNSKESSESSEKDTDACSICFDPLHMSPTTTLDCLHIFHYNCLHQWLLNQNSCPTCRRYTLLDIDYPALC